MVELIFATIANAIILALSLFVVIVVLISKLATDSFDRADLMPTILFVMLVIVTTFNIVLFWTRL